MGMEQSITQLKRNIEGYRLVNQYGLKLVPKEEITKVKDNERLEVIKLKECYIIVNKEKLNLAGIEIININKEYIKEIDKSILEVEYEKERSIEQVQYMVEKEDSKTEPNLVLIEEE